MRSDDQSNKAGERFGMWGPPRSERERHEADVSRRVVAVSLLPSWPPPYQIYPRLDPQNPRRSPSPETAPRPPLPPRPRAAWPPVARSAATRTTRRPPPPPSPAAPRSSSTAAAPPPTTALVSELGDFLLRGSGSRNWRGHGAGIAGEGCGELREQTGLHLNVIRSPAFLVLVVLWSLVSEFMQCGCCLQLQCMN